MEGQELQEKLILLTILTQIRRKKLSGKRKEKILGQMDISK